MNEILPPKFDLHVHTCYSGDCLTALKDVIYYAKSKGLSGVAITDHDTVEGALRLLKNKDNLTIIPGIEVSTNRGHILGINITAPISRGLSVKETIKRIHENDGIAVAAHPSAILRDSIGLGSAIASSGLDAVEVVNSSDLPFSFLTRLNKRFASSLHLPQIAGSDSHLAETVGIAYTVIENVEPHPSVEDVIHAIKEGMTTPFGRSTPWKLRFKKVAQKRRKDADHLGSYS